jgi:ribonucleoside-diphosphate reductase beta chain
MRRYFVKHILAFCCFGWNCKRKFSRNFVNEVTEAKFFYGFQIMMENIHSETFVIDWYREDEAEKDELFNALEVFLLLRKKQTGLWNGLNQIRLQSVWLLLQLLKVSFSQVHFVLFTGWKTWLMPGLTFRTSWFLVTKEYTVILRTLAQPPLGKQSAKDRIREIIVDAYWKRVYHGVVTSIFNGMNAGLMTQWSLLRIVY